MKFYFEPKQTIIQTIKHKITGASNRFAVCTFDDNGELETEDPKLIHILQTKLPGCRWDEGNTVEAIEVTDILADEDIRNLAKEKGIKHWHNKKVENLKKELGV